MPLKHLINFRGTLEIPLINFQISFDLTSSSNFVSCKAARAAIFTITDTKLLIPVVTLSNQDKSKLFQQLKSGTFNRKMYQSKVSTQAQNQYLEYLIDLNFQEVKSPFVLPLENEADREGYT